MALVSDFWKMTASLLLIISFVGCTIETDDAAAGAVPPPSVEIPVSTPPPPPALPPVALARPNPEQASRFLMATTFGPTEDTIVELVDLGYSEWFRNQLQSPSRSIVEASWPDLTANVGWRHEHEIPLNEFYESALLGEDQLRMRATFALSQIFVISKTGNVVIASDGEGVARYMDILQDGAFGNFRDLLEEVTYSPMMGSYLTYMGNQKANEQTGAAPDENFAREIMQLFTIGLYELNLDGTLVLDPNGHPIETYTNDDIVELAKAFTGLWWAGQPFGTGEPNRTQTASISRMTMHDEYHSNGAKTVLGTTIPEHASGEDTISAALDILFEHPNVAPFIATQLIQRMTTSNPSSEYIRRVSDAFETGEYTLPDGDSVGTGERGDLIPVWAAIVMDDEFHNPSEQTGETFGKVREPLLRYTHWARVANVSQVNMRVGNTLVDEFVLRLDRIERLGQGAFASPSVFNFYRPGYSPPGSEIAQAGLVAPEMQIITERSVINYANFMQAVIFRDPGDGSNAGPFGIVGDYTDEIDLANDAGALIDRIDLLMTAGKMRAETRSRLRDAINSITVGIVDREDELRNRVQIALLLTAVSPEFLVQQ